MNNTYLIGMTSEGNHAHLKEIIEPLKEDIDGICWVFNSEESPHATREEGCYYLWDVCSELERKSGQHSDVILSKWVMRNDYTRNKILFEGPLQYGDICFTIDTLERCSPELIRFCQKQFDQNKELGAIYLYGKRFAFRFGESVEFKGNPHETLAGINKSINLDENNLPQLKDWWQNVRSQYRDEFHWVDAYMNYYFFPMTNHLLLGYDYDRDRDYINHRYTIRAILLQQMLELSIPLNKGGLKTYIDSNGIEEFKEYFNQEKILNDWYRFHYLNDRTVVDKHDPSTIKEIKWTNQ